MSKKPEGHPRYNFSAMKMEADFILHNRNPVLASQNVKNLITALKLIQQLVEVYN